MEEDLRQVPKPRELARIVRLSSSRFNHLFTAETGFSPSQYLKALRMEKAKVLLESTFLNVKEIMTSVGLSDLSHFVRKFKKLYGITPSEYRKRHANPTLIKEQLQTPERQ